MLSFQKKTQKQLHLLVVVLGLACVNLAQATPRDTAAARLAAAEHQRALKTHEAEQAAKQLAAAQAQEAALADQRAKAAAALQGIDASVLTATAQLNDATAAQIRVEAALADRSAQFAALVPVMLRMSRYPAETVLAVPAPAGQAMEGLLVTRGLAAQLNQEAANLRSLQDRAATMRIATERQAAVLADRREQQAAHAAALDQSIARARAAVSAAQSEGQKAADDIASLAAQAKTLRDAIDAMDAAKTQQAARAAHDLAAAEKQHKPEQAEAARARQTALASPALAVSLGHLIVPVAGPVLHSYGAPADDGPATGITYAATSGAFVAAPCQGRVAFAAPFRSYGQLIILECGGGYDVVLAGLGRTDARPGQTIRPGEPLGRMPNTGSHPPLYVELRAHGQPVDPAPFLKASM